MGSKLATWHGMRIFIIFALALMLFLCRPAARTANAQTQKPSLPDPVKFLNKYEHVANTVREVLLDMGFRIELDDRKSGRIVTRPYEFITGSLTASELDKVAVRRDTITGNWLKAQYSAEVLLEIISPTETMVTVQTTIEALNRDVDGTEKWIRLESIGTFERRILGKISAKLLGRETPPEERKGFWGKSPQPVDPRRPRFPTVPGK